MSFTHMVILHIVEKMKSGFVPERHIILERMNIAVLQDVGLSKNSRLYDAS